MTWRSLLVTALFLATSLGLWVTSLSNGAPPAASADVTFVKDVVPFLSKHCYACHGNGKSRAGLALDKYRDDESLQKDRKVWENVLHMLRAGEMPPKEKPRPDAKESDAVLKSIDAVLAKLDCDRSRNAGRVTLRRLNRFEYNNTIRDLVGVDFQPAADFPNDDVGYGFDNIGDVLSLSPLLLERYLSAADAILHKAIENVEVPQPMKMRLSGVRVSRGAGGTKQGGALLTGGQGDASVESFLDEGDYVIRVEVYGVPIGDEAVKAALRVNRADAKEFEVKARESAPETLEVKLRLKAGTNRIGVGLLNPSTDGDKKRQLFVRNFVVDGPYDPPPPKVTESHKRIMTHADNLSPRDAAREIVTRFANRAFRRPVKPEEVERYLRLYDKAEKEGERFEGRVRLALAGVLVSPHFLFRVELDPSNAKAGTTYQVNEYELASRLSYFFWSTMPDEELINLAAKNELRPNLETQVQRMVKDPKSAAFVQSFAGQWLTLSKLANIIPDPKVFPNFDADLRAAMLKETELFFEAIVREDRSVLDLLDSDFSFVNERLAKHYGIEGVKGKEFQRVKLPPNRGGILTQASILTLTSSPQRTSPVKRGKWVLDQLLNTPPPPPPDDVPELMEEKRLTGSLRQVMEQHRENALCASCHAKMDPIGFAFENFDATGAWRDKDGGFAIDASGVLPDGQSFKGPAELKSILKKKKDLFCRSLTEKVLTYALGRGLEYYDRCAVDKILDALGKNDDRFSTLLLEVIKSEPFQMRTATGAKP